MTQCHGFFKIYRKEDSITTYTNFNLVAISKNINVSALNGSMSLQLSLIALWRHSKRYSVFIFRCGELDNSTLNFLTAFLFHIAAVANLGKVGGETVTPFASREQLQF